MSSSSSFTATLLVILCYLSTPSITTTTTIASSVAPTFANASSKTPPSSSPFIWEYEDENRCDKWTIRRHLFPYAATYLTYTHDASKGLLQTNWTGEVFSTVYQSLHSTPSTTQQQLCANISSTAITPDSLLVCSNQSASSPQRHTIVIQIEDIHHRYIDMLDDAPFGLNLWHFHANFFPIWATQYFPNIAAHFINADTRAYEIHTQIGMNKTYDVALNIPQIPPTISAMNPASMPVIDIEKLDVVLLLPPGAWSRLSRRGDVNISAATMPVFAVDGDELRCMQRDLNGAPTSLSGLQAISDGFKGRLIVASYETDRRALLKKMEQHGFNTKPAAWIIPPGREGFMWHLAEDPAIAARAWDCGRSIIRTYGENMVRRGRNIESDNDKPKLAKHICIMSRQARTKPGHEERFMLRNMTPDFFRSLVSRLSSPLVINGNLDIRNNSHIETRMDRMSISGQMGVVRDECAVLVGVHGAGLTGVLGMRRGTALVELMRGVRQYEFFINLSALMGDIKYHRVFANASTFIKYELEFEGSFNMDESKLDILVDKLNLLLSSSIKRQQTFL